MEQQDSDQSNVQRSDKTGKLTLFGSMCYVATTFILAATSSCKSIGGKGMLGPTESAENLPKPLVLADFCSLCSCVLKLQPSAQERRTRILIAYFRA